MLKGHIDRIDDTLVSGWAWDPDAPDRRIALQLCDGDDVIAEMIADVLRPDLATAGVGDGRYGYSLTLPPNLLHSSVHLLRVRFKETGADVNKSPQWVYPGHGGIDPSLEGLFTRLVENTASAATEPKHLGPLVALCTNALSRLLNAEARLEAASASVPVSAADRAGLPARLKQALERALQTCPALHVPIHRDPRLSIIIAGSARFRENHACIASILASPGLRDYEIIFVDVTGATDMVLAPFVIGGGIRFVATPQPAPALAAYRMGLAMARGERLLFLGHVASVAPGAIAALSETLDARERPAIVTPRLIGRDGRLLEAGASLRALAARQPVGQLELQGAGRFRVLRPSDDVSNRAFMVDKAVLASVGGFDGIEAFGDLGMADIAFRLREAGTDVLVQGFADVVVTSAGDVGPVDMRGRRQFLARWQKRLPSAASKDGVALTRRALVIDERLPDPTRDAASVAVLSHCEGLVELGFHVEFAAIDQDVSAHDEGRALFMRGVEAHLGPSDAESLLRSRAGQFDVVYLHRLSVARRLIAVCRETQPQARLVYSVADLHGLRVMRHGQVIGDEMLMGEGAVLAHAERDCLTQSDVAITHSQHEAQWIAREIPGTPVARVLWAYRVNPAPAPFAARAGFCFIGTYLHQPNIDAVQDFLETQWRRLHDASGGASFEIAGSHFELGRFDTRSVGVVARGYVADARSYLAGIRVMLAPLRFGAGVKGKVLLSLAEGLPCVMTETAAEGIELPDAIRAVMIASDDDDFIAKAAALHADAALWETASTLARDWARDTIAQSAITRQLAAALSTQPA